jgi:hypothetical protein
LIEELTYIYATCLKSAKEAKQADELEESKYLACGIYILLEHLCVKSGDLDKLGFALKEIPNLSHITSIEGFINKFISTVRSIELPESTNPDHEKPSHILKRILRICHENSSTNLNTEEIPSIFIRILTEHRSLIEKVDDASGVS